MPERDLVERLAADGLVRPEAAGVRPTRRWQAAMARAAIRLQAAGAPADDLRLPIASALVELYPHVSDEELASLVEAMLPIEAAALAPASAELGTPPAPSAR